MLDVLLSSERRLRVDRYIVVFSYRRGEHRQGRVISYGGQAGGVSLFLQNDIVVLAHQVRETALLCLLYRILRRYVVRLQRELRQLLCSTESVVTLCLGVPFGITNYILLNV